MDAIADGGRGETINSLEIKEAKFKYSDALSAQTVILLLRQNSERETAALIIEWETGNGLLQHSRCPLKQRSFIPNTQT